MFLNILDTFILFAIAAKINTRTDVLQVYLPNVSSSGSEA